MFKIELLTCIKMDFALNNLPWLICHKTETKSNQTDKCVASRSFCTYSFDDSTNSQKLKSCRSISLKTVLIFPENFSIFQFEQIPKEAPKKTAAVQPLTSHYRNYPVRWARYAGHCWGSKDYIFIYIYIYIYIYIIEYVSLSPSVHLCI